MSNTFFLPGETAPEKIIGEVEHGYYVCGHQIPSIAESRENFRISFNHQHHFAVVVDDADAPQPFMIHAAIQIHHVEIAEIYTSFGKRCVKSHHQRLVLGADGPN